MTLAPFPLFNYDLDDYEYVDGFPNTDEAILPFIPRYPSEGGGPARNLYRIHREQGLGVVDAYIKTLKAVVGDKEEIK